MLETLEHRVTPALTATYNPSFQTLTVTETTVGNDTIVLENTGAGQIKVSASNGTVLNTVADGVVTLGSAAKPVKHIVVRTGKGDDNVILGSNANPNFAITGNLTINSTTGNKTVQNATVVAGTISVGGSFSIVSTVGASKTNLMHDISVGHSMTIKNGTGSTLTDFFTKVAGTSNSFGGDLIVTNGAGFDQDVLINANVNGSVSFRNGAGAATGAGTQVVVDNVDIAAGNLIKGGLTVTNNSGVSVVIINGAAFTLSPALTALGYSSVDPTTEPYTIRGTVKINVSGGGYIPAASSVAESQVFIGNSAVAAATLAVDGSLFVTVNGSNTVTAINNITVGGLFTYSAGPGNSSNRVVIGGGGVVHIKGVTHVTFGSGGFNELLLATASTVTLDHASFFVGGFGLGNNAFVTPANLTAPIAPVLHQFIQFP